MLEPNPGPVAGPNIKRRLVTVRIMQLTDGEAVTEEAAPLEVQARSIWTATSRALRHFLKTRRRRIGSRTRITFDVETLR